MTQILMKRPEGMDFNEYKKLRSYQNEQIKKRLKGYLVWDSDKQGTFIGYVKNLIG